MKHTLRIQIGHLLTVLEVLYNAYRKNEELFASDLASRTMMSLPTLYNVRRRLKMDGYIKEITNPDRTVTIKLTEKGVKLAECLLKCKEFLE